MLDRPVVASAAEAGSEDTSASAPASGGLASRIVAAVPPGSPVERFLRSPLAFVAAGGASFVLVLGFGSLLLFGGADPELARIDSGKAGAVIEEIHALPAAARTPRQHLLLGHAYARNGATQQALDAYREAAKQGGADRRALDYTLAALDHPFAQHPVEVLVTWRSEDVRERLVELTAAEGWHLRHNALKTLQERGEATPALSEKVAIVDVRHGPDCDRRREGLTRLEALGKGKAALEAIQSLRDNYKENFCIPLTELDRAQLSVEKRR